MSIFFQTTAGKVIGVVLGGLTLAGLGMQTTHYTQTYADHKQVMILSEAIPAIYKGIEETLSYQRTLVNKYNRSTGDALTRVPGGSTRPFSFGIHVNEYVFPDAEVGDTFTLTLLDGVIESRIKVKVTGTFPSSKMLKEMLVLGDNVIASLGLLDDQLSALVMAAPANKFQLVDNR